MINLLPPTTKIGYYYARRNRHLIKWTVALSFGLIGLLAIGTYGWVNIHQSIKQNSSQIASSQAILSRDDLPGTEKEISTISSDFSLVVKVLSQEVVFSKLLTHMAAAMPTGANLTNLSITNTAGGTGLDISAEAKNYTDATQVQVNLADPTNGIFSKADLVSINCGQARGSGVNSAYPCSVVLRAEFAQNNQFLFINQQKSKS